MCPMPPTAPALQSQCLYSSLCSYFILNTSLKLLKARFSCLCFARRTKHDGPCKQRPMSEGMFSFSSLFSSAAPETAKEQRKATKWASVSADPWGAGRDLPSLLEQVSLKGRRDSRGMFCDDTATLPRRRVNLFSSLRLRKREGSASEGPDQEIRTILTNLRNKG